jgi:hypothetical protein
MIVMTCLKPPTERIKGTLSESLEPEFEVNIMVLNQDKHLIVFAIV